MATVSAWSWRPRNGSVEPSSVTCAVEACVTGCSVIVTDDGEIVVEKSSPRATPAITTSARG
jgi:hypothetical protein